MDLHEIAADLDRRLNSILSPARALHSRQVADLAARLCSTNSIDVLRGRVSGLAHDICKEMPRKEQDRLARGSTFAFPACAAGHSFIADHIPHGPAAAGWLFEEYSLQDVEILEAVALHTVGDPKMSLLASIVYCADKLEPGRNELDAEFRESCILLPVPLMIAAVCLHSIEWLQSTGRQVAPQTLILYNTLTKTAAAK